MKASRQQTAPSHRLQQILHSWNYGEHTFWLNDADCFFCFQNYSLDFMHGFAEDFVMCDKVLLQQAGVTNQSWKCVLRLTSVIASNIKL